MQLGALVLILTLFAATGCSERPQDTLDEIRRLHESGRYTDSLEPLQKLLDRHPDLPEANLMLGQALLRSGQQSLAIWPLRKAAEASGYEVEAGLLLSRALLQGRNQSDARTALDRVLEIAPENVEALLMLMETLGDDRRYEEALATMDRVLELDPENLEVMAPRVLALIGLVQIDEAGEALEAAEQKLLTTDRDVPEAMRARLCIAGGMFTFEKGDPEGAESRYESCLERYPTEPLAVHEGALFYDRIGQRERGTQLIRDAYEEFPDDFRGMLASRMQSLGDLEEQERLLLEETEENPSAPVWFTLADFYVDREDYTAAVSAFEQALEMSRRPGPMLQLAYADTLVQAGEYRRADQVAGDLETPVFRDLVRGRILLAQGDPAGALELLESGIRLWPDNATARLLAGQAAERLGNFDKAIMHYRESVRSGPGRTEAGGLLAGIYAAQGNNRLALDILRRYLQGHAQDAEAYLLAIHIAHQTGNHELASEGLARLAQLPGQAATAVAQEAELVAAGRGAAVAVRAIERSPIDLTQPINAGALRVFLAQLAILGEHDKANETISAAREAHPEEGVFHELQGNVLRASGAPPQQVREAFERAVELDPERAGALAGLAELAAVDGERQRALELYDRAAQADPDDPSFTYAATQLLLADGRSKEVERRLAALLEVHPRESRAAGELARMLVTRGRELDRALALARRSALFGPSPEAFDTLGWVQLERGEPSWAVQALTRALDLEPDAVETRYRLGLALESAGDEQGAIEALRRVVEAGDGLPEDQAAEARKKLARLESRSDAATP